MYPGFKKCAREIAAEIRGELCLGVLDPLDPWKLADHLIIPVWALSDYPPAVRAAVVQLRDRDTGSFSGMLVFDGSRRVIIHNDGHTIARQRANIAHELAHALLLHQPHTLIEGEGPQFDAEQEEEARWLSGVLLVTDDYCVVCTRKQIPIPEAAERIGVSPQLMQWRVNMSGAKRRASRAHR
jgi:Zn-dependent peptidase ImmA (M78 family)